MAPFLLTLIACELFILDEAPVGDVLDERIAACIKEGGFDPAPETRGEIVADCEADGGVDCGARWISLESAHCAAQEQGLDLDGVTSGYLRWEPDLALVVWRFWWEEDLGGDEYESHAVALDATTGVLLRENVERYFGGCRTTGPEVDCG